MDTWAGKGTSLAAIYLDIEEPSIAAVLPVQLNVLWNNGYTPYINLKAGTVSNKPTAAQIAAGSYDTAINTWAQVFNNWAQDGRWAFISILPEMNVDWASISYRMDPVNYKLAFTRIQAIFAANGVTSSEVRWVFAPNGWYGIPFEEYYPGDSAVNILGFSSYNFGACTSTGWKNPDVLLSPTITSLHLMAPSKPIFVSQLGTSAKTASGTYDDSAKNQWLRDAYNYLSRSLTVKGVIYDQKNTDCDWTVYSASGKKYTGYQDGIANQTFGYLTPAVLGTYNITLVIKKVFLPFTSNVYNACTTSSPILLAAYTQGWPGNSSTYTNEITPLNSWAGKRLSLIGTFIDIEVSVPSTHVKGQLETIWNNGYTPFINSEFWP